MLPALTIASALGIIPIYYYVKKLNRKFLLKIFSTTSLLRLTYIFLSFLQDYFLISPYKFAKDMLYGNLEAAVWIDARDAGMGRSGQAWAAGMGTEIPE